MISFFEIQNQFHKRIFRAKKEKKIRKKKRKRKEEKKTKKRRYILCTVRKLKFASIVLYVQILNGLQLMFSLTVDGVYLLVIEFLK